MVVGSLVGFELGLLPIAPYEYSEYSYPSYYSGYGYGYGNYGVGYGYAYPSVMYYYADTAAARIGNDGRNLRINEFFLGESKSYAFNSKRSGVLPIG